MSIGTPHFLFAPNAVATVNSGAPGALASISTGSMLVRPYGGKLTTQLAAGDVWGWSGILDAAFVSTQTLATGNTTGSFNMMYCCRRFVSVGNTGGNTIGTYIFKLTNATAQTFGLVIRRTGTLGILKPGSVTSLLDNTKVLIPGVDYEFILAWTNVSTTSTTMRVMYRVAGSGAWTTFADATVTTTGVITGTSVTNINTGGTTSFNSGRIGVVGAWPLAALADADRPSDIVPPPGWTHAAPLCWGVDPVNGSDSNSGACTIISGALSGFPWATWGKACTEVAANVLVGTGVPYVYSADGTAYPTTKSPEQFTDDLSSGAALPMSDRLVVDTTAQEITASATLAVSSTSLSFVYEDVAGKTGNGVWAWATIAPGDWTKTGGRTNVYQVTTAANASVMEDGRSPFWEYAGDDSTALAGVDSTPGRFWTTGGVTYYHPYGSTDPRSDGKTYRRSIPLTAGSGNLIQRNGSNCVIRNALLAGPILVSNNTGDNAVGGYALGGAGSGRNLGVDLDLRFGSKHVLGDVRAGVTDSLHAYNRIAFGTCSPHTGTGSATTYAVQTLGGTLNRIFCKNFTCPGSVLDANGAPIPREVYCYFFTIHGNGVDQETTHQSVHFKNGTTVDRFFDQNCINSGGFVLENVTTSSVISQSKNILLVKCKLTRSFVQTEGTCTMIGGSLSYSDDLGFTFTDSVAGRLYMHGVAIDGTNRDDGSIISVTGDYTDITVTGCTITLRSGVYLSANVSIDPADPVGQITLQGNTYTDESLVILFSSDLTALIGLQDYTLAMLRAQGQEGVAGSAVRGNASVYLPSAA